MNDMIVWGGILLAALLFGWLIWPRDAKPVELDPVKPEPDPAPVVPPVEPVVDSNPVVEKAPAKKAPAKKAPAKKTTAPKTAVKKGSK
jgi:hypothetical protein